MMRSVTDVDSTNSMSLRETSSAPLDAKPASTTVPLTGPSQARLRLENMASALDHKIAGAFTAILGLYAFITFGTWLHLEGQEFSTPIIHAVSARHQVAKTRNPPGRIDISFMGDRPPDERAVVNAHDIKDIETLQHTFPVHVGDDMEEIDHPGIALASTEAFARVLEKNPELPTDGKMRVPKFWHPVAYGEKGVREFLGDGGSRLITYEEARQIGSFDPVSGLETIYVSVASYRDPECQPTVEDIFLRAENPERIRVAIIDQRADNDPVPPCGEPQKPCSVDPTQAMCRYHHLIDVFEVPAKLSVGPVFARHLANRMYRGEYFAMQVDSHVRFIRNWDTEIVSQWNSAKNEMAVLSVYLSDITGSIDPVTYENTRPNRPIMCKTDYEGHGKLKHLRHGQQPEGRPGIHGEPTLHPFWAAGFSFARGHFVVQVPYDQFQPMVFQGEEIFQGLRAFTYSYDIYASEKSVSFHMYAIKGNKERRKKVKLFWENQNLYPGSDVEGMKRLNAIIGMGDPEDEHKFFDREAESYGLGGARPQEKFFKLYGIHTDTKTVEDHLCTFVGKPMMQKFKPLLRANGMGLDFTNFDFEWKDPRPKK